MKIILHKQKDETDSDIVDLALLIALGNSGKDFEIELNLSERKSYIRKEMSPEQIRKFGILPSYKK